MSESVAEWPENLTAYDDLTPLGRAAADYMGMGMGVIPLRRGEKIPALSNWTVDYSNNPAQAAIWWGEQSGWDPWGNIGIVCGEASGGLVYIDVDRHGAVDGTKSLTEWTAENGNLPETVVQQTGGGGYGFLFRVDRPVPTTAAPSIGIDIRGEGGQFVAPPSVHPNGNTYEWINSPEDFDGEIPYADENVYRLLDWIQSHAGGGKGGVSHKVSENTQNGRFELPPVIQNGARNDTLARYGFSLRARWADEETISTSLHDANRARCVEPLDDSEVDTIVKSVCRKAPGISTVSPRPSTASTPTPAPVSTTPAEAPVSPVVKPDITAPWGPGAPIKAPAEVISDGGGKPVEVEEFHGGGQILGITNLKAAERNRWMTTLQVLECLCNDPALRYVRSDVYTDRPFKCGPIPGDPTPETRPLSDKDVSTIWAYAETAYGVTSRQKFDDAWEAFLGLEDRQYDKIKSAFRELPRIKHTDDGSSLITWDGGATWEPFKPVAGTLFHNYLKAPNTPYTQMAEKLILRNIIGRATHPGCKSEIVPIFHGQQGIGKTKLIKLLALKKELLLPSFSKFDKDGLMKMRGRLIIEMAELVAFDYTRLEEIKAQTSVEFDTFRKPFGHIDNDYPRTCVFIGSTNDSTFLKDQTGGRRWYVIECLAPEECADPRLFTPPTEPGAARDIQQAYAEILDELETVGWSEFQKLMTPSVELRIQAEEARTNYTSSDYIREDIEAWLDEDNITVGTRICVKQVFMECYDLEPRDWARLKAYEKSDVSNAMDRSARLRRLTGATNYRTTDKTYGHPTKVWEVVDPDEEGD